MQVYIYDENKVFIESTFVEELDKNMTTVGMDIGYLKPTFNEETQEWFEGATEEEIIEWNNANKIDNCSSEGNSKTLEEQVKDLQTEKEQLWETVQFLLKKTGMIGDDQSGT